MPTLSITSYFTTAGEPTATALQIAAAFGIGINREKKFYVLDGLKVAVEPGQIIFITGQSGSGKSTLLTILKRFITPHVDLRNIRYDRGKILPDNFRLPLEKALHYLSIAGLADAFLFLRKPHELSDGQRYRFKLALALARRHKTIFADEFLDNLDRVTARVIAHNTRKFATKFNTTFILASTKDDLCDALQPDLLIEKQFGKDARIARHPSPSRPAV